MSDKKVKFTFRAKDEYKTVYVAGDFTNWQDQPIIMKKNKSGEWAAIAPMAPGEHEYKFIADGQWMLDPKAHHKPNNIGSENSIIRVD